MMLGVRLRACVPHLWACYIVFTLCHQQFIPYVCWIKIVCDYLAVQRLVCCVCRSEICRQAVCPLQAQQETPCQASITGISAMCTPSLPIWQLPSVDSCLLYIMFCHTGCWLAWLLPGTCAMCTGGLPVWIWLRLYWAWLVGCGLCPGSSGGLLADLPVAS